MVTDQLVFWKTDGYRGSSFIAKGNSQIKENNKTISADGIIYNDSIQLMSLINNCKVIDMNRGIGGNEINIQYSDSKIQSIEVTEQASVYNDIWAFIDKKQKYRDTMFANSLYSKFLNDKINELIMQVAIQFKLILLMMK